MSSTSRDCLRRLLGTLADNTPAFRARVHEPEGSRFRRLLIALADASPAFAPQAPGDSYTGTWKPAGSKKSLPMAGRCASKAIQTDPQDVTNNRLAAAPSATGRRAATRYLRQLLARPGDYRRTWERNHPPTLPGRISQLAVARVLARQLKPPTGGPGNAKLSAQVRGAVSRLVSGRPLSRSALALFIAAFGITEDDQRRLWRLWEGSSVISVLSGSRAVKGAEEQVRAALGLRPYRTVSLDDHLYIGPDRRLVRCHTVKVIQATSPNVDRIVYLYNATYLILEVGQGCKGTSGNVYELPAGVALTEIILDKTLGPGEMATIEYWTTFCSAYDPNDPGQREYRRVALNQVTDLSIRVEFDPAALPKDIWWAKQDRIEGAIVEEEPATMDSQHSVHRRLPSISEAVVGFHWSW